MMDMQYEHNYDRICGSILGGAAGDALGYAVEFTSLKSIRDEFGPEGITEYETDPLAGEAIFSDDTQMTLFTAAGIMAAKNAGVTAPASHKMYRYVHSAYLDWYKTQSLEPDKKPVKDMPDSWLMDIPQLYKRRAPGNTCLSALASPKKRDLYKPINHSKGCGGIMRVAPVGLLYPEATPEQIVEMGAEISAITHGHPYGCFPSGIFAAIVQQAYLLPDSERDSGDPKEILAGMLDRAVAAARNLYGKSDMWDDLEALIYKAVEAADNDKSDFANLKALGEGWVAEETLAVALYCTLKYADDFSKALTVSVNHDGDSDSTGAVTGNILGALIGYEAIPDKWKEKLEMKEVIFRISREMADENMKND